MNMNLQDDWAGHWNLKRRIHTNHGSFGATPTAILKRQAEMVAGFNMDRDDFLWGDNQQDSALNILREAIKPLAAMTGAQVEDMVFVDNVTDGFNSVIKSLPLKAGDEVLITNHIYANFPTPLKELARRQGFDVVVADIPYPVRDKYDVVNAILAKVTSRTKLAIVDHITSPTAMIFPVQEIVSALKDKGIDTFVDGAHAPGQIALNIDEIGAAYYSANNHKWLSAPAGSGFLHVRRDRQDDIIPAVGSGAASREAPFVDRFTWRGTKDLSPHLMVPQTLEYMAKLHPKGWAGIYERNHALALAAREMFVQKLGLTKLCPDDMVGCMFSLPLGKLNFPPTLEEKWPIKRLRDTMIEEHGFGVCAPEFEGQQVLRISAHLYNNLGQYEELATALVPMLKAFAPKTAAETHSPAPQ